MNFRYRWHTKQKKTPLGEFSSTVVFKKSKCISADFFVLNNQEQKVSAQIELSYSSASQVPPARRLRYAKKEAGVRRSAPLLFCKKRIMFCVSALPMVMLPLWEQNAIIPQE